MSDTGNPVKPERDAKGRMLPGNSGNGGGRKHKRLTSDVEDFLIDALNIKGARMLVEAMTEATKLCGKDAVEHPDWPTRIHAFEVARDTVIGRPAQVITGEGGGPLFGALVPDMLDTLKKLAGER